MRATMRAWLRTLAIAGVVFGFGLAAATPGQAGQGPGGAAKMAAGAMAAGTQENSGMPAPDNPVADPKAVVTTGNARFTVLTPQLIRMEWSADGKFEDHASLVFINRRLPAPKFVKGLQWAGKNPSLLIQTDALTLRYAPSGTPGDNGHFAPQNLSITLTVDGKQVVWHPGDSDPDNLMGTTARWGRRRRSRSGRGWCRDPDGRWWMTRRGHCSTRPIFVFLRAKRALGRG